MSAAELKIDIIKQITNLSDEFRLRELLLLLKYQSDKVVYTTNKEEKTAIEEARTEIANGDFLSYEEVKMKIGKCLGE